MGERGFDLASRFDAHDGTKRDRSVAPADRIAERGYFAPPPNGELPVLEMEETLVFASNNYLGLTANQRVQEGARQAVATVGTGTGASRVVSGDTLVHHDLERVLAEIDRTDRALVYHSHEAAVIGTITALSPTVVFADECVTPSVRAACQRCDTETVWYSHRDESVLREEMASRSERSTAESWLVVTDSVFEATGTIAPLEPIADVTATYDAWLMVDESHAMGLYADGGGIVRAEGLESAIDVRTGSLGTALASQGGYVTGDDTLIEYLATESGPFTAGVGLTPPAVGAASESLHLACHSDVRHDLWDTVSHLRDGLESIGYPVETDSQIVPITVDDPETARELHTSLRDAGILTRLVDPVCCPDDRSRVRLTPLATHTPDDIVACLQALQTAGESLDLI